MNTTTVIILITTLVIILATLLPTYLISKKKKTTAEDWAIASRDLPLYVIVGTQFASVVGGGILVGHLANAFTNGIGIVIYGVLMVMPLFILSFLAKWLRKNEFSTIPDIFKKLSNNSKPIIVIAAFMTMLFPFGWITSQITAFGNIYSEITGINYTLLCIIFAIISLLFIMPSGLKTVAWTDFIFACFMVAMLIITAIYGTQMAGGFSGISANANPDLLSLSDSVKTIGIGTILLWVFSILPGGLTNQLYYQRICAIKDEKQVNKSLIISGVVSFIGFLWAVYMGVTIQSLNPGLDANLATGWFMGQLPIVLLAGFAGLVFATMMSTVSSAVQSIVVNISRDVVTVVKPDIGEKQLLNLSRLFSIIIIALSLVMCLVFTDTLTWLIATAGFSAATLLCPIFLGYILREKRFLTNFGIGASMVMGAIGATIGMVLDTTINYAVIGILFSLAGLIVGSALTKNKNTQVVQNLEINEAAE